MSLGKAPVASLRSFTKFAHEKDDPMLRLLTIAMALLATPASARKLNDPVRAIITIDWAHNPKDKLIADLQVWRCLAATCTGTVIDRPHGLLRTCRQLARAGGRVISFKLPRGELSADILVRCNRGLKERKEPAS